MKNVINDEDIQKADNITRARYLKEIARGNIIYTQDLKIGKGKANGSTKSNRNESKRVTRGESRSKR